MTSTTSDAKIKILIACHLPCILPKGEIFVPVHGGRFLKKKTDEQTQKWLEEFTTGDDSGVNISIKNGRYNEMTVIYWAWKNYEQLGNPEYIGFMHYRRHFIFGKWKKPRGGEWLFNTEKTGEELENFTGMNQENILACVGDNDILYPYYPHDMTVYRHYKISPYHRIEDLELALSIIKENFPDYHPYAQSYVSGKRQIFCNMFIMRKEIFFEYCQWIFSVLEEYDRRRDYRTLSQEEARFFISERLTGIFIHRKLSEGVKATPLPLTLLKYHYVQKPAPAFNENNVPVVFATDDLYIPVLGVALQSLVASSSSASNYDILILHEGLDRQNMLVLRETIQGCKNFSLRYIDVRPYFTESERKSLFVSGDLAHITFATYYRFVLSRVFSNYDKILYLDGDIIINDDIAKLYVTDLQENWIGAVPDIRESIAIRRNFTVVGRPFGKYVREELGLGDSPYFQAGVLLYNIRRFNDDRVEALLFAKAKEIKKPVLMDQDILNSVCQGHVHFLPVRWNVEWQIGFEFENFYKELSPAYAAAYAKALKNPAIVHYASPKKPWNSPPKPFSSLWWRHAAKTPWYEFFMNGYESSMKHGRLLTSLSRTWMYKAAKICLPAKVRRAMKKLLKRRS